MRSLFQQSLIPSRKILCEFLFFPLVFIGSLMQLCKTTATQQKNTSTFFFFTIFLSITALIQKPSTHHQTRFLPQTLVHLVPLTCTHGVAGAFLLFPSLAFINMTRAPAITGLYWGTLLNITLEAPGAHVSWSTR